MRSLLVICITLFLTACAGGGSAVSNLGYFDLGPAKSADWKAPQLALSSVDVRAPSWLEAPTVQYRLAYANDARRASYAESRWVAPPAELLEKRLQRRLVSNATSTAACRLRIDLDEFVQSFDKPGGSSVQIDVRATLLQASGSTPLVRQSFSIERPTATADALGAITAFGAATESLTLALRDWLDSAATQEAAQRCKPG